MEYATITYSTYYLRTASAPTWTPEQERAVSAALLREWEAEMEHMMLDPLGRTRAQAEWDRATMLHLSQRLLIITLRKVFVQRAMCER